LGRLKFLPGSFLEHALPKADVVMMGHILHDWNLETKRILVRKAYEALPNDGAYIVYESIIDDDRCGNAVGLLMSLNMLIETADGFNYTGADCSGWMKEAGFHETRVEHLARFVGHRYQVAIVPAGACPVYIRPESGKWNSACLG
jgi:hypothetical protein